jgi:hypothetical protein
VRVRLALAAGLLLIAIAAVVALAHAPLVPVRESSGLTHAELVRATGPVSACQGGEVMPRGTAAIRFGLTTVLGPRVIATVFSGARLVARGERAPGWEGASVTVPVRPRARTLAPVRVCLRMNLFNGPVGMLGRRTGPAIAAVGARQRLPGRMHIEYLRPARASWWSMASAVAGRLGLGRAASGSWNALLVMALAATLIALSSWLVVRELG